MLSLVIIAGIFSEAFTRALPLEKVSNCSNQCINILAESNYSISSSGDPGFKTKTDAREPKNNVDNVKPPKPPPQKCVGGDDIKNCNNK